MVCPRTTRLTVAVLVTVCALLAGASAVAQEGPVGPTAAAAEAAAAGGLTLDETLETVAAENEDWAIAELRVRQAEAARREALASLLPQVGGQVRGTRYGQEIDFGGAEVRPQYDWSASGTASIVVFDAALYPTYARAGDLLEATRDLAAWQRHTLTYAAHQAFYTLAAAQQRLEIARATVELREAQLAQAEALLEAGIAVGLDVTRVRTQLLEAEQAVVEAAAAVGNAADALATLMAREPDGQLRVELGQLAVPAPPESVAQAGALDTRRDLAAAYHELEALEETGDAAWGSLLPTVLLSVDGDLGPESAFSNPDGFTWSASVLLQWTLYAGGRRFATIDRIEAEVAAEELALEQQVREARVDIVGALREWRAAVAAIAVAEQRVEAAQESYEAAQARFEAGLGTSIEVADASEALFEARLSLNTQILQAYLAASEFDYLTALDGR